MNSMNFLSCLFVFILTKSITEPRQAVMIMISLMACPFHEHVVHAVNVENAFHLGHGNATMGVQACLARCGFPSSGAPFPPNGAPPFYPRADSSAAADSASASASASASSSG